MLSKSRFHYETDEGPKYTIGVEFYARNNRPYVKGGELYNKRGEYVGYWDRENMPMTVVHEMQNWLRGDAAWAEHLQRNPQNRRLWR